MLTAVPAQIATDIHKDLSATSPLTFQHAVQLVKKGQPLSHVVQALLSELTKIERLSLLDGDETFYKGLRKILCDRYNREPFVHGAAESERHLPRSGRQFRGGAASGVPGSHPFGKGHLDHPAGVLSVRPGFASKTGCMAHPPYR